MKRYVSFIFHINLFNKENMKSNLTNSVLEALKDLIKCISNWELVTLGAEVYNPFC